MRHRVGKFVLADGLSARILWVNRCGMVGESLCEATEYFQPFPEPHIVFASRVERHSEFLLPLATLSLRHVCDDWDGNIHFVVPIEPADGWGVVGENSREFHNYLCRPNWVGYRISDDKYELACDFRFFHKEYYAFHAPADTGAVRESNELPSHYQECRREFSASAEHFAQHACLPDHRPLVEELGGVSRWGNWSNTSDMPLSRSLHEIADFETTEVLPMTEDGRALAYIGSMPLWNYFDNTNGVLMLFYDAQDGIALTTVDWT